LPIRPRYADLFESLCDPDQDRADRAFDAILFDRGEAVDDLAQCYQESPRNAKLRYLVIQLMSFSGDKRATPMVVTALNDRHPVVRAEACRGLEDLKARGHIADLEARLGDVDPAVREAAGETLEALRR
jgi:HEAT repeat protein